jgi:hypothetical protein
MSKSDSLSSKETGSEKLKKPIISGKSSMSEGHWWYLFHREVKSWDSTAGF